MSSKEMLQVCNELVTTGREHLGMSMGIVSHIEDDDYEVIAVSSTTGVFVAGENFPLQETYCRDVYKDAKTLAITEVEGRPGLQSHPLYPTLGLEAYLGTPIMVDNKVWGTVNFTSFAVRIGPFSKDDISYAERIAEKVATIISSEKSKKETSVNA